MKKVFLNKIKKMLEGQKSEMLEKAASTPMLVEVDIDGDDVDVIQGHILAHTNSQLVQRDKEKMMRIDKALKKIDDGSFGVCEECSEDIAEKRLMFNPGFSNCISCAEAIEIENKKVARG